METETSLSMFPPIVKNSSAARSITPVFPSKFARKVSFPICDVKKVKENKGDALKNNRLCVYLFRLSNYQRSILRFVAFSFPEFYILKMQSEHYILLFMTVNFNSKVQTQIESESKQTTIYHKTRLN